MAVTILTKAERMGLQEVCDYRFCARTEPVKRRLIHRKWIRFKGFNKYVLTRAGAIALGVDPDDPSNVPQKMTKR